jgi:hypothetical protein
MAKKLEVVAGVETLCTYIDPKCGAAVAILANGTRYVKTVTSRKWKLYGTKKADVSLETWTQHRLEFYAKLPEWCKGKHDVPTMATLQRWSFDGVAKTVDGQTIEPDGTASNGAPSWLLLIGVI